MLALSSLALPQARGAMYLATLAHLHDKPCLAHGPIFPINQMS